MKILEDPGSEKPEILQNSLEESKNQTDRSLLLSIVMLLIGIGFTVIIGIVIIRAITKPLEKSVEFAKFIAAGDLTVET